MTDGTSQGLFIVVAIVIFGIFVVMAYILFEDTLSPAMASMFNEAIETTNHKITEGYVLVETINKEVLFDLGYRNEFVRYGDIAHVFDTHGEGAYRFVFDLKTVGEEGNVSFYFQNGAGSKYGFHVENQLYATKTYKKFTEDRVIRKNDTTDNRAYIAFYGTYGTGVLPAIRNMKIYKLVE